MGKNIVLIGFMGTGKSSVGLKLSQRLKRKFIDMDREIEKITGMTVSKIFRVHGETRFRSEEKLLAKKLSQKNDLVIATGGGVVLQEENVKALQENGILICLDTSPEDIFERVSRKKKIRPLIKKNFQLDDIKNMLAEREQFYSCADYRICTSGKELNAIVEEVVRIVRKSAT